MYVLSCSFSNDVWFTKIPIFFHETKTYSYSRAHKFFRSWRQWRVWWVNQRQQTLRPRRPARAAPQLPQAPQSWPSVIQWPRLKLQPGRWLLWLLPASHQTPPCLPERRNWWACLWRCRVFCGLFICWVVTWRSNMIQNNMDFCVWCYTVSHSLLLLHVPLSCFLLHHLVEENKVQFYKGEMFQNPWNYIC